MTIHETLESARAVGTALLEARRELERLRQQNEQLVASNGDLSALLLSADRRHGESIKVIVALRRLMEAGTAGAALRGLEEILINVVGTEDFVVLALAGETFVPIAGMGPAVLHAREFPAAREILEQCVAHRRAVTTFTWHGEEVAACIPLRIESRIVGAVAIASLLAHRGPLNVYDDEVLRLLGDLAATAILAADHRTRWTQLPCPELC
jgi:hypothetical protein